jgi:NADPH-dependent 2,4-dienoyl-CoA reductase/sulfur reductase-like enzyme
MATGVRPNVELAKQAGIATGAAGAIRTTPQLQTNIPDIYACGDCVETFSAITGKPFFRPRGSIANKLGRIAGIKVTAGAAGETLAYRGCLSTSIAQAFDYTVASTGLSEKEALAEGFAVQTCRIVTPDKAGYMRGENLTRLAPMICFISTWPTRRSMQRQKTPCIIRAWCWTVCSGMAKSS